MNNGADDRRVRKTKKALRQGLVSLLEKKKLKDITVRELTDTVDLHRGTFYVHYRDIYELYEKMWQEAIQEIRDIFRQYPPEELPGGFCHTGAYPAAEGPHTPGHHVDLQIAAVGATGAGIEHRPVLGALFLRNAA